MKMTCTVGNRNTSHFSRLFGNGMINGIFAGAMSFTDMIRYHEV